MRLGDKTKGYCMGIAGAVSYGLNPLFTLPLYTLGLSTNSVLFYRYAFAIPMLALLMLGRRESFKIKWKEVPLLLILGLCFSASSMFLYLSYNYMSSGIASTLLFVYPALVAVLMMLFFHERFSWKTLSCVLLVSWGIYFLYQNSNGETLSLIGTFFVFLSALSYSVYLIGVNRSSLKYMAPDKLTFYAIVFGSLIFIVMIPLGNPLQPLTNTTDWINTLCLAFFPTVFSLTTTTSSIHYIGSTPTAILGALEPITALVVGYFVFGESITMRIACGVILIVLAVTILITGGRLKRLMLDHVHFRKPNWRKLRP